MDINEFLKKVKAPAAPTAAKKKVEPKEDEARVITKIVSTEGDNCLIDYNGVPFKLAKKEIVDIEPLEGDEKKREFGQLVSLIVKKECVMDCKLSVKVGDLIQAPEC